MKKIIGCVIPCYKVKSSIFGVIDEALEVVDKVIVIDDNCPYKTGKKIIEKYVDNKKVEVIINNRNLGVGGATKVGIRRFLDDNFYVIVKVDADGQIPPKLIPALIKPIFEGRSDAAKGNRLDSIKNVKSMPFIRLVGNLSLSFLNKLSTGYWELFDPTNGFIAIKSSSLKKIRLEKVDNRYFFESGLLFQCSLANICFSQLSMESIYGIETSSMKPLKEIYRFGHKHIRNFFKRVMYQYFLLDFNIGSLEIIGGTITSILLLISTVRVLISGLNSQDYATPGEASLIGILSIITTQLILGFLYFDATQKPLMRRLYFEK